MKRDGIYIRDVEGEEVERGTPAISEAKGGQGSNISLMMAISPVYGVLHYKLNLGSNNSDTYSRFLLELLQKDVCKLKQFTLVHDNAKFHLTDIVKDVVYEHGFRVQHKIVELPPYSPQLNPIELVFAKLTHFTNRERSVNDTTETLMETIQRGIKTITEKDCDGYYRHVTRYYIHCAAGNKLEWFKQDRNHVGRNKNYWSFE
jgi:transposase